MGTNWGQPAGYFQHIYAAKIWGEPYLSETLQWAPSFWAPKNPDWVGYVTYNTGGPFPIVEWMPYILTHIFWFSVYLLSMIFLGAILQRIFIKTNPLRWPYATMATTLINMTATRNIFRNKWLWIGILTGFLVHYMQWGHFAFPEIISMEPINRPMVDIQHYTYDLLPNNAIVLIFEPWQIGVGNLLANDVLISLFIFSLILWAIYPPIAWWTGITGKTGYVQWPAYNGGWWYAYGNWGGVNLVMQWGYLSLVIGGALGLLIWTIYIGRKELIASFKSSSKKEDGVPGPILWLGFIACTLITVAFLTISGSEWWLSLFVVLGSLLWYFMMTWVLGETGGLFGNATLVGWEFVYNPAVSLWTSGGLTPQQGWAAIQFAQIGTGSMNTGPDPIALTLEDFRIGESFKTRNKDVLIAAILGALLCTATYFFGYLYGVYATGAQSLGQWYGRWANEHNGGWLINQLHIPFTTDSVVYFGPENKVMNVNMYTWFAIGAAIVLLMFFVRMRAPGAWWALHPVAWITALLWPHWLFPSVLALLLKWIIMRVGGAPAYEQKLVPLSVGWIVSYGLNNFVSNMAFAVVGVT
jgi:hypothetical protein